MMGVGGWFAGLAASAERSDLAANVAELGCEACCTRDWCHCDDRVCDCHAVLKSQGYSLPASAATAYAAGGMSGWTSALDGWRSADIPRWDPVASEQIEIKDSKIVGAGKGLFARAPLPKWSVLPPYQGMQLSYLEVRRLRFTPEMEYMWCPMKSAALIANMTDAELESKPLAAQPTYCVDGKPSVEGNPSRFVNAAAEVAQCAAVNVEICELGQVMYFRTTKPVPGGAELLTNYGPNYWEDFRGCPAPAYPGESRVIWSLVQKILR